MYSEKEFSTYMEFDAYIFPLNDSQSKLSYFYIFFPNDLNELKLKIMLIKKNQFCFFINL